MHNLEKAIESSSLGPMTSSMWIFGQVYSYSQEFPSADWVSNPVGSDWLIS